MNILFLTLLYPEETKVQTAAASRDGLQNQIDNYQRAFVRGIRENLRKGESLELVNSLPVGIFPLRYRKLWLRGGRRNGNIRELPGLNLPWFKQKFREWGAEREILRWAKQSPENRTLLVYTLYEPYMKAIRRAKRRCPDLKAAVIVTDLPNQWGLASYRKGLMKKIEYAMGREKIHLCSVFDGFVLLTEPMREVLPVGEKPFTVIEGLILEKELPEEKRQTENAVLYTGTLNRELGIAELLRAFEQMPEVQLWLCGRGDMEDEVRRSAEKHPNIRYFGFVSQEEALSLQGRAATLINPRSPEGLYTRYSFPSKTLEYLRSGRPTLCYALEGIPEEYGQYLIYIQQSGADGIRQAVQEWLQKPAAEREARGRSGREYVLQQKNPKAQCNALLSMLRRMG